MSYTVEISHDDLIDALEDKVGGVWEHIQEGEEIETIRVGYASIFITIGKEEVTASKEDISCPR